MTACDPGNVLSDKRWEANLTVDRNTARILLSQSTRDQAWIIPRPPAAFILGMMYPHVLLSRRILSSRWYSTMSGTYILRVRTFCFALTPVFDDTKQYLGKSHYSPDHDC